MLVGDLQRGWAHGRAKVFGVQCCNAIGRVAAITHNNDALVSGLAAHFIQAAMGRAGGRRGQHDDADVSIAAQIS